MNEYKVLGLKSSRCCELCDIPRSSYYYSASHGNPGRLPSTHTQLKNGKLIENSKVCQEIISILDHPFVDYGYLKVTHKLRQSCEMIINPKKVYRLMKESKLLSKKVGEKQNHKKRVSGWKVNVSRPFELIEIDIKYIYVKGDHRHYYMLNLLDCYSWKLLSYRISASIKKEDVIALLKSVFALYGYPEKITLRSDNGSQFIAKDVAEYIKEAEITHEFTHVATPQENGYVECFHSILARFLRKRGDFENFFELETVLKNWTEFYNEERLHKGCGYKTPNMVMREYYDKNRKNVGKNAA